MNTPVNREEALALLREHADEMRERFGVCSMKLFGSFARDEVKPESDVDILVEFEDSPTWRRYSGASAFLEDLFGRRVDLCQRNELRDFIVPYVDLDMSMSDTSREKEWIPYLADMIEACGEVLLYVEGLKREEFFEDKLRLDATLFQITMIGIAATWIPEPIRELNSQVPWAQITETGKQFVQNYDVVDEDVLWLFVTEEIPDFVGVLERIGSEK